MKTSKFEIAMFVRENMEMTTAEIAEKFAVSELTVKNALRPQPFYADYKALHSKKSGIGLRKEEVLEYAMENMNLSIKKIADHFEVSTATIQNLLSVQEWYEDFRRGSFAPLPEGLTEQAIVEYSLANSDLSVNALAKHFGLTNTRTRNILKRAGVQLESGTRISEETKTQILAEAQNEVPMSVREMELRFETTATTIYGILKKAGVFEDYRTKSKKSMPKITLG